MGFVEHHQIPPRRVQQALDARRPLQRVDAGDQPVMLGEGVGLAVGHVAFGAEDLEIEVEDLVQFAVPVVHQPAGTTISARFSSPRLASSRKISAVSMVLPRPTSSAIRKRRGDAVAIRWVSTTWCGSRSILRRRERRSALHHRQRMGLVGQPCLRARARRPLRPSARMLSVRESSTLDAGERNASLAVAEKGAQIAVARPVEHNACAELADV